MQNVESDRIAGEVAIMETLRKSPALAGVLSLMPGLGQVYIGYYVSGFVNIVVVAGCIAVLNSGASAGLEPFLGTFLAFFWMFNVVDAVRRARLYNFHQLGDRGESLPTDSPLVGGTVLLLAGILFTLHVTFGVNMDFLGRYWPVALLGGGAYLIGRYLHQKGKMQRTGMGG